MSDNSYLDYWGSVRGICEDIKHDIKNDELDRDDVNDRIHEEVDSSQWVIYTYKGMECLLHSRNEDAFFEEGMGPLDSDNFSDVIMKLAYYAMAADVRDVLGDLDDIEDDDDEEEDEEDTED